MKHINQHRAVILAGKPITHNGKVYFAKDGKIWSKSVEDYLENRDTAVMEGRIAADGTIRRSGNKFKSLREAACVSVNDIAKATGIPKNTLQNFDQGQRSLALARVDIAYRIAMYFGISIEDLISEDWQKYEAEQRKKP